MLRINSGPAKQKWELQSRLTDRIAQKQVAQKLARAFKAAVWARDQGRCQRCGIRVIKTLALDPKRGEIHHVHPRSTAPSRKFDVNNAVLWCRKCHGERHGGRS
jgi:5-methylcytosine-specific restriction endonuclease McrA